MKSSGFVLVTVLFILSVLMLMTLSQWQSILIYQRMLSQSWTQKNILHTLEEVMQWHWHTYQTKKIFSLEGSTMWGDKEVGYRLIKKGTFPCIHFEKYGQMFSTRHVEIRTWLINQPQHVLRVRLAKIIPLQQCAAMQARLIDHEIISWQYVIF